jgi:MHS family citrate/tricarballylate:H+ symporter-like MFS transporter
MDLEPDRRPATLARRHVLAATLGNALEFYDFLTYAFFSIQIGHAFFPAQGAYASLMLSLATFGSGFVTRPIGALFIGSFSDRVGRRPAMILSYALMGGSIVALAVIPSYAAIGVAAPVLAILVRMIQGFSLGGEVGCNTAFLMEAASLRRRGLVVSWQGASQYIASAAASLVGLALTRLLAPDAFEAYGWRIAFLLGALTLPFGLWLRRSLPETLHEPETGRHVKREGEGRLRTAWRYRRVVVLGLLVLGAGTIGTYIFQYIATYAQATLHMRAASGFAAELVGYTLSIGALLLGGWLSDRVGRRPVTIGANLALLILVYPVFLWITTARTDLALVVGVAVLTVVANFPGGAFYAALSESLPKTIRGGAFAVVYAVSVAALGGTTQLVVTWLIHVTGDPIAPAWYLIGATAVGQVALLLMPESAPVKSRDRTPAIAAPAITAA